jgi:hypothetical protein
MNIVEAHLSVITKFINENTIGNVQKLTLEKEIGRLDAGNLPYSSMGSSITVPI